MGKIGSFVLVSLGPLSKQTSDWVWPRLVVRTMDFRGNYPINTETNISKSETGESTRRRNDTSRHGSGTMDPNVSRFYLFQLRVAVVDERWDWNTHEVRISVLECTKVKTD